MDTINDFPIIATFSTRARGAERGGRHIIVDRGAGHEEQYVVAWQGLGATAWGLAVYCRDLDTARALFVIRIQNEVL